MLPYIPIVHFFKGNKPELKLSIKQANLYNKEVILLGDKDNIDITKNHYYYLDYNQEFETFTKVYEHMSTNSFNFEICCFQRFFVIKEWMLKNKIHKIFMTDSDVLVYGNLTNDLYLKYLPNYEAALCIPQPEKQEDNYYWTASSHVSFWTLSSIKSFTDFCINIYYSQKEILYKKYKYYQEMQITGGICDMTLLYLWSKDNQEVFNLLALTDNLLIDHNINIGNDFKNNQYKIISGIKSIYFINELPYASGTKSQFLTLHFQGSAKRFMPLFINGELRKILRNLFYTIPIVVSLFLKINLKLPKKIKVFN